MWLPQLSNALLMCVGQMAFRERYMNKIILAPMVRICTLPMRLLCLELGADLVYTEELVDLKLVKSERRVNDALGTIDYVDPSDGTVIFRTCCEERDRVVLQIGTCCPVRALEVAKLMEQDIAGIDINMGCPKEFSLKGGMGAALLSDPEKAVAILTSLVSGVSIPVTCKVRVLNTIDETVSLCKKFEEAGISAIAVHGRTKNERPHHPNRNDFIRAISEALSIPVIANGGSKEMECYEDIEKFKTTTGASSAMVARAAAWNPSVFRRAGTQDLKKVIARYLQLAVAYGNNLSNTKYCVQYMLREDQESPLGRATIASYTLQQLCDVWGVGQFYEEHAANGSLGRWTLDSEGRRVARCRFVRALYTDPTQLPKSRLARYSRSAMLQPPVYATTPVDKLFKSTVTLGGVTYVSEIWEKNKRFAEQGAALAALASLGLIDSNDLRKYGVVQ